MGDPSVLVIGAGHVVELPPLAIVDQVTTQHARQGSGLGQLVGVRTPSGLVSSAVSGASLLEAGGRGLGCQVAIARGRALLVPADGARVAVPVTRAVPGERVPAPLTARSAEVALEARGGLDVHAGALGALPAAGISSATSSTLDRIPAPWTSALQLGAVWVGG